MLKSGLTIGIYEILSPIGAGGMGEVYLAKDSRLDRQVAIKALPEHLAADPDRLGRFEREARTLASLNHPNVAGIYGVEEQDGRKYLVLEYVEGQTLAERLDRGALPIDEALEVCTQIAAGVEAAHEAGVIHRDLKPANVKITPDGKVKVLDFGLAKVAEGASSNIHQAETISSPAHRQHSPTMPGVILGTAAYMSPEQARGRPLDKRTDIWSFGVVLYESLTGANPFVGETVSDCIGAILHKDLDWSLLPPGTPATVQLLLRRCLNKDCRRRVQHMGDARVELEEALADPTSSALGLAASAVRDAEARSWPTGVRIAAIVTIIVLVGLLGIVAGRRSSPKETRAVRKYEIPPLDNATWNSGQPAISPDGTMVAFVDRDRVWLRRLNSFDAREVQDSEHGVIPFWSPDSEWLGFGRRNELVKVPASGGRPVVITKAPRDFSVVGGAAWSRDDRIFFSTGDTGILEVSADGGEPRMYVPCDLEDDDDFHELALLPDGRSVVFTVHSRSRTWYLAASDGTQRKVVLDLDEYHLTAPAYSPTGHLLFSRLAREQGVWALPFSVDRLEATGDPFLVAEGDGDPSVSHTGVLAMTRRIIGYQGGVLVKTDLSTGDVEPLLEPGGALYHPSLSPDGTTVALAGFNLNATDIWLLGVQQGTRTRLTFDDATNEVLPQWSSDGREIAFAKTNASTVARVGTTDTIHFVAADGSGETREPIPGGYPTLDREWNFVAFERTNPETGRDIYYQSLNEAAEARPIIQGAAFDEQPALSPDGEWLAYTSNESGVQHVYLTRFPSGRGKWQVSPEAGIFPVWSPDGTRLYFVGGVSIYEVEITTEPRVMLGRPRSVMEVRLGINPYLGFSLTPDGDNLVAIQSGSSSSPPAIGVIENWYEEFKDRR